MKRRFLPSLLFLSLLLAGLVACDPVSSPVSEVGAGIAIAETFAPFYSQNGGRSIFGYPITAAYTDSENGRLVQYFENMKLAYDPAQPPGEQVVIAPLGEWALGGVSQPTPAAMAENSESRLFPETGFAVQDAFLTFYETQPGATILGPPISAQLDEGGVRVQYFRNGRLEWHPEAPLDQRIQVGPLGQSYFVASGDIYLYEQQILAQPADAAAIQTAVVEAAVRSPILYAGDEQTIYIQVTTPEGRPVPDAVIELTVSGGATTAAPVQLGPTNARGMVRATLPLEDRVPGEQVEILVTVRSTTGAIIGTSVAMFKTWW